MALGDRLRKLRREKPLRTAIKRGQEKAKGRNVSRRGGTGRPGSGLRMAGGGRPRYFRTGSKKEAPKEAPKTAPKVAPKSPTPRISDLDKADIEKAGGMIIPKTDQTPDVAPTRATPSPWTDQPLKPVTPADPVIEHGTRNIENLRGQEPTMPSTTVEDVTDTPIDFPTDPFVEPPDENLAVTPELYQGQDWSFKEFEQPGHAPIFGYNPNELMGGRDAVADLFDTSKTWDARRLQQQGRLPKGVAQPSVPPLFPQLGTSAPQEEEENSIWDKLRARFGDAAVQELIDEADEDAGRSPAGNQWRPTIGYQ